VEVWFSVSGEHFLMIHGHCIKSNEEFYLFNVYPPCDQRAKLVLWNSLSSRLQSLVAIRSACVGILTQYGVGRRGVPLEEIMCQMTLKGLTILLMIMC